MDQEKAKIIRKRASSILEQAGIIITNEEHETMEVADCGFDDIDRVGLQVIIYANSERYCAKELILFPWQLFPEHKHPRVDEKNIGKQETFRCRWGEVYLYVEGEPVGNPLARVPQSYGDYLTVWNEIVLRPGDQYTLMPDTKHWFQAGPDGAVVSEFSSTSLDETDVFTDPRVERIPVIDP